MEKFLGLLKEKQIVIINAALLCFGTNGYKKTSISDIAESAGISKSMVFHYFGSKKDLYVYLITFCGGKLEHAFDSSFNKIETDFFERVRSASLIEIAVLSEHPALISFLQSVYFEKDEEVYPSIKEMFAKGDGVRSKLVLEGMDTTKFKDNVDIKLVLKILTWIAEGYTSEMPMKNNYNLEELFKEFNSAIDLLKNNLYKEEFI